MIDTSKFRTEHPGGYPDILETLQENSSLDVSWQVTKIDTHYGNYVNGKYIPKEEKTFEDHKITCGEILHEIRGKINHDAYAPRGISGIQAGMIQSILAKYGLPTPTDKRWLNPASTWFEVQE